MKNDRNSYLPSVDLPMDTRGIERSVAAHLSYTLVRDQYSTKPRDLFSATALAIRDRITDRWRKTRQRTARGRQVYYLSLEYLIGRLLEDSALSLGIVPETNAALGAFGSSLATLVDQEDDAGLGNGGLGRLAACFLDSMATLDIPAMGYGIRYEYGIFRQAIVDGQQVEHPDNWLRYPNPWEVPRTHRIYLVKFGGVVRTHRQGTRDVFEWTDTDNVVAMAYDIPVPGYRNNTVNTLRLWSAEASREFDIASFSRGDYWHAVQEKTVSENLSRVLYPNDQMESGRDLRLRQEFFFVSATVQDAVRRHLQRFDSVANLHQQAVFQLNDTHPAVAVAELMRLLLDEQGIEWDEAWSITSHCFAYTNHTVLPEALEHWPVSLFARVLPRHLQIVLEINRRFLGLVRERFGNDLDRLRRMSLVDEGYEQRIRMAHLAIVGSTHVNGVSALHSRIVRERLFRDFAELWPEKFGNQTNGVTPRRWLRKCNPALSDVISGKIGDGWIVSLPELAQLKPYADDPALRAAFRAAKRSNKQRLVTFTETTLAVRLSPDALFDVQIKRIHEYKRQLLPILHAVHLHLLAQRGETRVARVVMLAGKAAPGYDMAKRIIQLANDVAYALQSDERTRDRIQLVFYPNYSVSLAEQIVPAADLSEQVSTAGTEASGTGNMKLSLNGALTIGTLDGANIEIREAVGEDNFFVFGMTDEEILEKKRSGHDPRAPVRADPELAEVLDVISSGAYAPTEPGRHRPVIDALLNYDPYYLLSDYTAYAAAQREVEAAFLDPERWARMMVANVAGMGRFSSDETIRGYARDIWHVTGKQ
jgi:starch phosphorylase